LESNTEKLHSVCSTILQLEISPRNISWIVSGTVEAAGISKVSVYLGRIMSL